MELVVGGTGNGKKMGSSDGNWKEKLKSELLKLGLRKFYPLSHSLFLKDLPINSLPTVANYCNIT